MTTPIKAHKVILSACSPFFNRILKKNSHNHPLIYMSDVNLNDLKAIVNFIYLGQTNVEQENLQRFLKIAAKFQVRGLTDGNKEEESEKVERVTNKNFKKASSPSKLKQSLIQKSETLDNSRLSEELLNTSMSTNDDLGIKGEPGDLEDRDRDDLENIEGIDTSQFAIENMMTMTPTVTVDEDNKFPCDQCDYKATYACNLTSHKRTVHQGLYYSCSLCAYKSSRKDRLNKHYLSKHNYQNSF